MRVVDLFAGLGGFSLGARMAGCEVVWAANHWPLAVEYHRANHPETVHCCQDLHQADWTQVPQHDILCASPACPGHSRARGPERPHHATDRATAWAVVSALECHRTPVAIVENVPEFTKWVLYPAWLQALTALGYAIAPHVVDCADLGVPQHRVRLFLVLTRSAAPLRLTLAKCEHVPATTFIRFDQGRWSRLCHPRRAAATLAKVARGREQHGERFLLPYYGNTKGGWSLHRPIGTITTRDRWGVIDGDRMRMLSVEEARTAMTFPRDYALPANGRDAMHLLGNAVPPLAAQRVIEAVQRAA